MWDQRQDERRTKNEIYDVSIRFTSSLGEQKNETRGAYEFRMFTCTSKTDDEYEDVDEITIERRVNNK